MANRGLARERQVAQIGTALGYLVSSLRHFGGPGDQLWTPQWTSPDQLKPLLVEVKGTTDVPWWSTWGPDDRAAMIEAALVYCLEPICAWWPPRLGAPIWLPVEDWPA